MHDPTGYLAAITDIPEIGGYYIDPNNPHFGGKVRVVAHAPTDDQPYRVRTYTPKDAADRNGFYRGLANPGDLIPDPDPLPRPDGTPVPATPAIGARMAAATGTNRGHVGEVLRARLSYHGGSAVLGFDNGVMHNVPFEHLVSEEQARDLFSPTYTFTIGERVEFLGPGAYGPGTIVEKLRDPRWETFLRVRFDTGITINANPKYLIRADDPQLAERKRLEKYTNRFIAACPDVALATKDRAARDRVRDALAEVLDVVRRDQETNP